MIDPAKCGNLEAIGTVLRRASENKGTIDIVFLGEPKSESSDFARAVATALKEACWIVNSVERVPLAELHLITTDLLVKRSIDKIGLAVILERTCPSKIAEPSLF
ncbi:MAG TPA: hypothetical protein VKN18_22845 [Blastocatellia bacterium]|nr:hypothetical protein [Blastocatellia bacterium]